MEDLNILQGMLLIMHLGTKRHQVSAIMQSGNWWLQSASLNLHIRVVVGELPIQTTSQFYKML